ncbi:hypothetical protein Pcinc_005313 [Petrolisthes cinctipes]|uniref:Uncharacterized protein n=1 Tax=Petrolisthes cinctipes TaxID=88211 RepID=A0AAE1KZF3_PETCI|nr:hypothetical protein Pcinc_005313 [Petrolisthes cinctipes]
MLLTPSPASNLGSRRQSTCSITSLGGLDSRRSSTASINLTNPLSSSYKHRRPSALISNASSGNLLQQLSAGVGCHFPDLSGSHIEGLLHSSVSCLNAGEPTYCYGVHTFYYAVDLLFGSDDTVSYFDQPLSSQSHHACLAVILFSTRELLYVRVDY